MMSTAVLALTSCGGDLAGDADQAAGSAPSSVPASSSASEEPTAEEAPAPTGQSTETAAEPSGELQTEGDPADVPELAELEEAMWETAAAQQSVTVTMEMPAGAAGLTPLHRDLEDDSTVEILVSGELAGADMRYSTFGYEVLIYGDLVYQSVDDVVDSTFVTGPNAEDFDVDAEEVRRALSDQGSWISLPAAQYADAVETPETVIDRLRQEYESRGGAADFDAGQAQTRDDVEVWVYTSEQSEIVITADHDEPLLREVNTVEDDHEIHGTFTEWNSVELPAEPEGDQIISSDQLQSIVAEFL